MSTNNSKNRPTIKEAAAKYSLQPTSLQKRIKRLNEEEGTTYPYKLNEPFIEHLEYLFFGVDQESRQEKPEKQPQAMPDKAYEEKKAKTTTNTRTKQKPAAGFKMPQKAAAEKPGFDWAKFFAFLPLPMLGLAASYGVYFFASYFVPQAVAIGEAAAFELTYIGIASLKDLSPNNKRRALRIAYYAVFVSVVYNTLAGALHLNPEILQGLQGTITWIEELGQDGQALGTYQASNIGGVILFWVIALVHGVPPATLAYQVADLHIHKSNF